MSFLNQLKSQAQALEASKGRAQADLDRHMRATEDACRACLHYLQDLVRQLNVISPEGPALSLDGKTPWPAMKLGDFRIDSRKKMLLDREAFDFIAVGWDITPRIGDAVGGTVTVNFPPDLERVESRLALGTIKHERKEVRHPEKNTLQALRFDYETQTRGNVRITPDHASGMLAFRLLNLSGFGVVNTTYPVTGITSATLDELAKLIVGQPSRFC